MSYAASSRRLQDVSAPIIPAISSLISEVAGTISLGQGVAWYGPPEDVARSIAEFFDDPDRHRYGSVTGHPELVAAIAEKLGRENACELSGRRIVVTAGANMAFLHAMMAILDPGDEVILPLPYYFNQEMAVRMVHGVPVSVSTDADFQIDPERIKRAITPRTKAVVTISPNNPTGAVYSEQVLRQVNGLCQEAGIYHISDEAYEYFTFDGAEHFSPSAISNSAAHTISLFSLSKAYGFASWRIGYMVIPDHLHPAVLKVQDTNLICAPGISQWAAVVAMKSGVEYCRGKLKVTAGVRQSVLLKLEELQGVCDVPAVRGAFYILLRVHTGMDSITLAERLIREFKVAVIPGVAFGMTEDCYLRVSYGALDEVSAVEGMNRLVKGLKAIVGGAGGGNS